MNKAVSLSTKQSRDINLLKGISILLVLFIHANIKDVIPDLDDRSALGMWTQTVTRIFVDNAVPMFFLVSGFLFFLKSGSFIEKWKKRVRTLLVPYILWCGVGFLIPFVLQEVLGLAHLFSGNPLKRIADFDTTDYIRMFWDIRDGAPILSTMWFLRDLIVMVLLTPVFYWMAKRMQWFFPLILTFVYLFLPFKLSCLSSSTLFWFGMGCWSAIGGGNLFAYIEHGSSRLIGIAWLSVAIATIVSFYYDWQYDILHNVFGVVHFVAIYKCISVISSKRIPEWLMKISEVSFFIYAFHEPWMGYVLKMAYKVFHFSGAALYTAPFVLVAFAAFYSYMAYILLQRLTPRLLSLLTGARSK